MHYKESFSRRLFVVFNYFTLTLLAVLCILPLIHVLAISFSSSYAVAGGHVWFWPVEFTTRSYRIIIDKKEFLQSMIVTLERIALGVPLSLAMTLLVGYPLSKEVSAFRFRTVYAWFFVFTMLFGGGLIPTYMTIKMTGIMNTLWALVIPGSVAVFNCILLLNFFRGLPKELEESAFMDGAGHWRILWSIAVPLSTPALATITLFTVVGSWNSWFDGLIYMNNPDKYPLASYLQTVIIKPDLSKLEELSKNIELFKEVSDRTSKAAQIFLGALPILLLYPFLQRFFVKGIVLGSVKE